MRSLCAVLWPTPGPYGWEIAPQSIDILDSVRQPLPDERPNVAHPRPRTITKNSKDGSSILPGAWRRQEGKTTGMEVS